jgi:hypothetical protein
VLVIEPFRSILPSDAVQWLQNYPEIQVLNVAGSCESLAPGIGVRVERFLIAVFRRIEVGPSPHR